MKIFGPKSLSNYLFYVTKSGYWVCFALAFIFLFFFAFGFIAHLFQWENAVAFLHMPTASDSSFYLQIPFLGSKIESNMEGWTKYLLFVFVAATLTFYLLLFKYLSQLFKGFSQVSIFKESICKNIKALAYILLAASLILFSMISWAPHNDGDIAFGLAFMLISVLLFFIAQVFKEGLHLQQENDLTI